MFFNKASKQDFDILPPPPPFPSLEIEEGPIKEKNEEIGQKIKEKFSEIDKIKFIQPPSKIKEKQEKKVTDFEQLEKEISEMPKPLEKKSKKSFFRVIGLAKTPEEKEAIRKAKEEKGKAREEKKKREEEEKKKQKEEEKKRKELKEQKWLEERERIMEEKRKQELAEKKEKEKASKEEEKIKKEPSELKEEPLPGPEQIEIEKPPEISEAEQEIEKAIETLKKPKKSFKELLFNLFKRKEKIPKHKIEIPKMGEGEFAEKITQPEIRKTTDAIKDIKQKIHDARGALMDFDLVRAKTTYMEVMQLYNNLIPEKQALVYEEIKDLYYERKNAESLNLKA